LSPTRFALGGWRDADDFGQWKQGSLWIYSLTDSMMASYSTRIVSSVDYERYAAAWNAWLLRRYRTIVSSRPRS
jgi:cytosine/uracil/thiamine/allantoin permease